MASDTFTLEVVTPEREVVREPVAEVQVPGREGYLGILPGHTPLLTELGIGALSYRKGGADGLRRDCRRFCGSACRARSGARGRRATRRRKSMSHGRARPLADAEKDAHQRRLAVRSTDWDAVLQVGGARADLAGGSRTRRGGCESRPAH